MNRTYAAIVFFLFLLGGCASASLFIVTTSPSGADIFVDGKPVGKTPATIKVKFAENAQMVLERKVLSVKLPGYGQKKAVIAYYEDMTVLNFQLTPDRVESSLSTTEIISRLSATRLQ